MEQSYRSSAVKSAQMADYLLSTTYKLIKEPKTLLSISEHVLSSFMSSVSALLAFERTKKTIPPYHENNESKLNCFREHVAKKYDLQQYLDTIERINYLSQEHKKAPIEFTKDKKYVICSDQFTKIETISEEDVKNYIRKAKEFVIAVDKVTV